MNIEEIENEIESLENDATNWSNIQRLSWLYVVRDHIGGERAEGETHASVQRTMVHTMPEYGGEFGEAVSGVDIDGLMPILSEHMDVIKLLHPKEYQAVLDRIKEIP